MSKERPPESIIQFLNNNDVEYYDEVFEYGFQIWGEIYSLEEKIDEELKTKNINSSQRKDSRETIELYTSQIKELKSRLKSDSIPAGITIDEHKKLVASEGGKAAAKYYKEIKDRALKMYIEGPYQSHSSFAQKYADELGVAVETIKRYLKGIQHPNKP